MEVIVTSFGGGIEVTLPPPVHVDGIVQYVSNASQIGVLVLLALSVGALGAWYESVVLLGSLPVAGMLAGIAYGCVYVLFAVAVVACATALLRSLLGAVALAAGVLLGLPLLGLVGPLGQWLPSHLVGALGALAAGAPVGEYTRAVAVTLVLAAALLPAAARLLDRREI